MRCAEPASFGSITSQYGRVATLRDQAPIVLDQIALRKLRLISLAVAYSPTCSARELRGCGRSGDAFEGAWSVRAHG
jgi:hypothetical protein